MDFLGLRTLTVISDALRMVRDMGGPDMKPEDIPLDDPAVYDIISRGDTDGIFQLEGSGMRSFLTNMKPESFSDIIAAISLYRPGPMESIPRYIAGKQDPSSVTYLHEKTRAPYFRRQTAAWCIRSRSCRSCATWPVIPWDAATWCAAPWPRKKVGHGRGEGILHTRSGKGRQIIVPGAVRMGVPEKIAEQLFDEMSAFASYAFNKSHAAAYGVVAVETAYLKCHYTAVHGRAYELGNRQ